MTTITDPAPWLALHRQAVAAVQPVYGKLTEDALDRQTPCAGWNLGQLLAHLIGQDHGFAAAVRADVTVEAFRPRPPEGELASALSASLTAVQQAFAQADPDRLVLMPEFDGQRFPLAAVIGFHFIDTLVHGWDVAAGLGISVEYSPELVAAALAQTLAIPDGPFRDAPGAAFARPLARTGDPGPWAQTLLWLGRDPEWSPTASKG